MVAKKAATKKKKKASKRQPAKSKLPLDRAGKKSSSSRNTKAKRTSSAKKKTSRAKPVNTAPLKKAKRTRAKQKRLSIRLGPNLTLEIILKSSKAKRKKSQRLTKKQLRLTRKRRQISAVAFIVLGIAGSIYFTSDLLQHQSPPPVVYSPPVPAVIAQEEPRRTVGLPPSEPIHLHIPDANIDTSLMTVGRNSDGTMEVPESFEAAGWYKYGPTPGEIGPSIIVGHVDSVAGPAVFWRLSQLEPEQLIEVKRTDGELVTFVVTDIKQFDQDDFPTDEVYGNIDYAGLRLITCGGWFDHEAGRYSHNTVVYARLQE